MLLICKKIIYLILLCPKNATWQFSFSNDPWVQTFVPISILQCFFRCLGLIRFIYKKIPKKNTSHMEQHKTQHISIVEIHNSEPTIWSNHFWSASFSPSSFKSKSPLNKVQRDTFFFDAMFSSSKSKLCFKNQYKADLCGRLAFSWVGTWFTCKAFLFCRLQSSVSMPQASIIVFSPWSTLFFNSIMLVSTTRLSTFVHWKTIENWNLHYIWNWLKIMMCYWA